jgi:hypothetical protein
MVILLRFHILHIIFLLFSMKASSDHAEGAGAAPRVSSSMSIGDLWLEIDSS